MEPAVAGGPALQESPDIHIAGTQYVEVTKLIKTNP
jgi:hypothetical protein